MAEEDKELDELLKEGSGGKEDDKKADHTENRFNKLAKGYKEKDKEVIKLKAEIEFRDLSPEYPNASKHKDDIMKKVDGGMSVKDAVITTLHDKGELAKKEAPAAPAPKEIDVNAGAGGSADIRADIKDKKDLSNMTQAEKLNELKAAEARGEIVLD